MTPVEEIRKAAALMRERAEAVYPPGLDWSKLVMAHSGTALDHAASWHPQVALAIADLLEDEADRVADFLAGVPYAVDSDWIERNFRLPLAVARTYLGGAA